MPKGRTFSIDDSRLGSGFPRQGIHPKIVNRKSLAVITKGSRQCEYRRRLPHSDLLVLIGTLFCCKRVLIQQLPFVWSPK